VAGGGGGAPGVVQPPATGMWGYLDVRAGWNTDAILDDLTALDALGAEWVVITVCGDDASAAEDTVQRFGTEVVRPIAVGA
jgi:hypothetical protein